MLISNWRLQKDIRANTFGNIDLFDSLCLETFEHTRYYKIPVQSSGFHRWHDFIISSQSTCWNERRSSSRWHFKVVDIASLLFVDDNQNHHTWDLPDCDVEGFTNKPGTAFKRDLLSVCLSSKNPSGTPEVILVSSLTSDAASVSDPHNHDGIQQARSNQSPRCTKVHKCVS